jgi:hypothetical protein
MRYIASFILLLILVAACGTNKSKPTQDKVENNVSVKENYTDTVPIEKREGYEGSFSCEGNCKAIHVLLIFGNDFFELHEERIDDSFNEDEDILITKGRLYKEIAIGYEDDKEANRYRLNYDLRPDKQRHFVKLSGKTEIFEVKSDGKRFSDGKNHTLQRKTDW